MTRVGILGCSALKLERPAPAAELYQGQLFRKSLVYARASCAEIRILSARYRVVRPETVLEPYNESLLGKSAAERARWGEACATQLAADFPGAAEGRVRFVFLCGLAYRSAVIPFMRRPLFGCEEPLAHLRQGEQLQWLKARLQELHQKETS